jgi:hypothetical protein
MVLLWSDMLSVCFHSLSSPAESRPTRVRLLFPLYSYTSNSAQYIEKVQHNFAVLWAFGFLLFLVFLKECAGSLCNFVQMLAEPGKAVATIRA